jgi:glycosyltransferase 2 family protein
MDEHKASRQRLVIITVAVLALVGLLVVILDWREVRRILGATDWTLLPIALAFTAVSYICLSLSFALVNRMFGLRMGWRFLTEIGFVSTTLNHLLSAGGAAGYAVRFLLMGEQGASIRDILAASLFNSYFEILGMLAMLPIGLVYLYVKHPLPGAALAAVGVGAVVLVLLFFLGSALVFVRPLRIWVLRGLGKAARLVTRRDVQPTLDGFDATMSRGVGEFRTRPALLVWLVVLVVADWASSVAALGYCFDALGEPIRTGVLLTGFVVGVTVGVLSMVPGGLGVQELSMAGVYRLLGVPLEQAALAAILFRLVYYIVPYVVSLGFYYRLLRQVGHSSAP